MSDLRPSTRILHRRRRRARAQRERPRHLDVGLKVGASLLVSLTITVLILFGLVTGAGLRMYSFYADQLPDIESLAIWEEEFQTVRIYDRTGEHLLIVSLDPRPFSGDRTYVSLDTMSPWIWKSALALEDRSYWTNPGINLRGITRAFVSNLSGSQVQGGSSITQQLIKNIAIPFEERAQRSYARKIKEFILALELTRKYDKQQILEWYLNFNFYGNLAYGIEAASRVYFDKSSGELTLAEASMLAAIPQYQAMNPFYLPEQAKERQRLTLDAMAEVGYITAAEADQAFAEELVYSSGTAERFDLLSAPHFGLYVLDRLQAEFNTLEEPFYIWKHGLSVRTTLDLDLQKFAEETARRNVQLLKANEKNASNAGVVAIEPASGEIRVMVGSIDYEDRTIDGQVNVALADRQPGSSFKPYVYIAGLEQGMTAADMLLDVRTPFTLENGSIYVPENFDRQYHGPVSFRTSLARSYNIPSIKIMETVGVGDAIRTSQRLGITGLDRGTQFYGLSLVLGGGEISLLDHTYAYSVLGNGGVMAGAQIPIQEQRNGFRLLEPISILEVTDAEGNILRRREEPQSRTVLSPEVHYVITHILSDDQARAQAFGFDSDLTLSDRPVAAKTGTTNNIRDTWALGYTPQLAVGVWVGNTDNTPMEALSGLTGAAPIWNAVMHEYHQDKPIEWYDRPANVTSAQICVPSGLKTTPDCQSRRTELFIEGTQPELPDNLWQAFEIDQATGQLANFSTLPENRVLEHFLVLPIEAQDWVIENGIPQPPSTAVARAATNQDQSIAIFAPAAEQYVGGLLEVEGRVDDTITRNWRLELVAVGSDAEPQEFASSGGVVHSEVRAAFNTYSLVDGLYSLRLVVHHFNGMEEVVSTSFFIDNTQPEASMVEPAANRLYVFDSDEQVNMHVEASDQGSVSRVEFWLNDEIISTQTIAPFNERWRLVMQDIPEARLNAEPVSGSEPIVDSAGEVLGHAPIVEEQTIDWFPDFETDALNLSRGRARIFHGGFSAIHTFSGAYLEKNLIHARVFDRAGNETRTEPIPVYVVHKEDVDP